MTRRNLKIAEDLQIPASAVSWRFTLSQGPGGQNVNKVATAVELRIELERAGLDKELQRQLCAVAGSQVNQDRVLVIRANTHRSQWRNRNEAVERLKQLVSRARRKPRRRIPSRPTKASIRKRRDDKRRTSEKKRWRRVTTNDY